jgi:FtsH-binding integral membrane protein
MPHFARADQLAIYFQARHLRASRRMYWLAASAVTVVIIQTLFFPNYSFLVIFEIAALLSILGLLYWNRRQAWHEKWINDRFLAEALRIRTFAALAGRETRLRSDPGESFVFYRGPQTWLLDVPDRLERAARTHMMGVRCADVLRGVLLDAWIKDQQKYQAKTAAKNEHLEHVYHQRGLALFAITLVAAGLHLFDIGHPENNHGSPWHFANVWIVLAIALPAWGASLQAIKERMEFRRIAARASRMASVLEVVALRFEEADSPDDLAQAVAAARSAMAAENYEWWILLGFRDPALPA